MIKLIKEGSIVNLSLFLYMLSLVTPASMNAHGDGLAGYQVLFFGWIAVFTGQFAWLANIFIISSLIFILKNKFKHAIIMSLLSIIIGLESFLGVPTDVGGTESSAPSIAFYLWEMSFVILSIYSLQQILAQKKKNRVV